jgi:LacI family transcriptional regulator
MSVTVSRVARAAGVSPATVSRVLNGSPLVAPPTAAAVERAVTKLGYRRPSSGPRGRPRRALRTGNAAFLVPDTRAAALRTPLTAQLVHAIERALARGRVNLIVTHLRSGGDVPSCLGRREVDGVMVRAGGDVSKLERALAELPCVVIFETSRRPGWADQVHPDNAAIGHLAFSYLAGRGRSRLAVVRSLRGHASERVRTESFLSAASEAGVPAELLKGGDIGRLAEQAWGRRGRGEPGRVDGFFIPLGDANVEGAYRALASLGADPCGDVDIVSCNNDPARLGALDPRLANIDIRAEHVGKTAAELLLRRVQNPKEPQRRVTIAPRLVPGRGSAPGGGQGSAGGCR